MESAGEREGGMGRDRIRSDWELWMEWRYAEWAKEGKKRGRKRSGKQDTHLTRDLPQQEPRKLGEDTEHGGERVVVH